MSEEIISEIEEDLQKRDLRNTGKIMVNIFLY